MMEGYRGGPTYLITRGLEIRLMETVQAGFGYLPIGHPLSVQSSRAGHLQVYSYQN